MNDGTSAGAGAGRAVATDGGDSVATDGGDPAPSDGGNPEGSVPGDEVWEDTEARTLGGKPLILVLYAVVVSIAGLTGFMIGALGIRGLRPVTFLGLVTFQPTAVGLAAYGVLTMGLGLGVLLGLVVYVSRNYVDEEA